MPSAKLESLIASSLGTKDRAITEWGDMYVSFERSPAGKDNSALFKGLPDDRCQCPHWGYLLKGSLLVRYADREETFHAGEAFYIEPGHRPLGLEDYELLEFTPRDRFQSTLEAAQRNARALKTGGRPADK